MLPQVVLQRLESTDQGSLGFFSSDTGWQSYSLELPWRDNASNISCVPAGEYSCVWAQSQRYGWKYLLEDVPHRTWVRAHKGNYAGDKTMGFKTHSAGCILLGSSYGYMDKQRAVFNSGTTVRRFEEHMAHRPFKLVIIDPPFSGVSTCLH